MIRPVARRHSPRWWALALKTTDDVYRITWDWGILAGGPWGFLPLVRAFGMATLRSSRRLPDGRRCGDLGDPSIALDIVTDVAEHLGYGAGELDGQL